MHPLPKARASAPLFSCHMLRDRPGAQRLGHCFTAPARRASRPLETRVSPRPSRVSVVGCAEKRALARRHASCCPRPRDGTLAISPYALPGSDSPAGTAGRSIELEESATPGHLLQPGRVARRRRPFLAFVRHAPTPSRRRMSLGAEAISGLCCDTPRARPGRGCRPGRKEISGLCCTPSLRRMSPTTSHL